MNLLEALDGHGVEYRPHKSKPDEIWLCCPFCPERGETPDTRFRFGINYVTGEAHCFNCDKRFRDFEYLMPALDKKLATGEWRLAQEAVHRKVVEVPPVKLPPDFKLVAKQTDDHWEMVAWKYLHSRGVTPSEISDKRIGFSMIGEFQYRIVIPVYVKKKLEGIVARAFVRDLEPKYKNSLGRKVLYNVPDEPGPTAILVEGVFDALAVERAIMHQSVGGGDAMGVLGHTLTDRQLEMLEPYETVILWTDPDIAGVKGLVSMGQQLLSMKKSVLAVVPNFWDRTEYEPADLDSREIRRTLKCVQPYTEEMGQHLKVKVAFLED